jgi:hypothetical protein
MPLRAFHFIAVPRIASQVASVAAVAFGTAVGTAVSIAVVGTPAARAQTFTFIDVANSTSPEFSFSSISGAPRINDAGMVAFFASRDAGVGGGQGIYKATDSSSFTTVALTSSPEFTAFGNTPSINNSGTVVFTASRDAGAGGGSGLYKATDSSSFTTVALTTGPEFSGFGNAPSINDLGMVAFTAGRDAGGSGIYKATDSSGFTPVALTTSPEFSAFIAGASINTSGTVAFYANTDAGGSGIYTASNSSSFTPVALNTSPEFADFIGTPSINSLGRVAFYADTDAGGQGIYTATDTSAFTPIALTTSPEFAAFGSAPSINSLGTVAFLGARDGGGTGIYVKLSSAAAPVAVIRAGDALFGSTVSTVNNSFATGLGFANGLAAGSDKLAFNYRLANGVVGIARVDITATAAPEPPALALVLFTLPVAGLIIRKRRKT